MSGYLGPKLVMIKRMVSLRSLTNMCADNYCLFSKENQFLSFNCQLIIFILKFFVVTVVINIVVKLFVVVVVVVELFLLLSLLLLLLPL